MRLCLIALLLLPACQGPGMQRIERRMDRLGDSIRTKLGPDRVVQKWGRRLDHAIQITPEVLLDDDLRQLERSSTRAVSNLAADVVEMPRKMGTTSVTVLDKAAWRLDRITDPPETWRRQLSPDRVGRRVRHIANDWPRLLMLDKPILPSLTDPRHRTDPNDTRPVETWAERILKRLGI